MDCKIKPSTWQILVRMEKAEVKTTGGLYLPDANVNKSQFAKTRGLVMAMGPLVFSHKDFQGHRACEIGDVVFIPKDLGMWIPEGEGDDMVMYKLIDDTHVKGTYDKEDKE